jgi:hypothetical protein
MSLAFPNLTKVKLTDLNPRSEVHGDVKVPALDMRFSTEVPNHVLALLHPELREHIYQESTQGQLPGVDEVSDATELRFPELAAPFKWTEETEGNTLTVDYGIGGESNILFTDCKLHKQTFLPKRGGTCAVSFTVTAVQGLTPHAVGHLGVRVQHDMHIQLQAGEPIAEQPGN